jgi:hypothetical protein
MSDYTNNQITFLVRVRRSRVEDAIIPVVAMTAEEACKMAFEQRHENFLKWDQVEKLHYKGEVVGTRGFVKEGAV